jgi:hypothetical protein
MPGQAVAPTPGLERCGKGSVAPYAGELLLRPDMLTSAEGRARGTARFTPPSILLRLELRHAIRQGLKIIDAGLKIPELVVSVFIKASLELSDVPLERS